MEVVRADRLKSNDHWSVGTAFPHPRKEHKTPPFEGAPRSAVRHGKAAAIKSKYETILTAPAAKTKRSIASRKITTLVNCKSIAALWPLQGEVEARQTLKDARVIPNNYSRSSPAARSEDSWTPTWQWLDWKEMSLYQWTPHHWRDGLRDEWQIAPFHPVLT